MTPLLPNPEPNANGLNANDSLAAELRQECERLRQLAEKLQTREDALAFKEAEHKSLIAFAYAKLREMFEPLEEIPGDDLEAYAKSVGGEPLEAWIDDLHRWAEGA